MVNKVPPLTAPSAARFEELPLGTVLWRIHSKNFSATEFNPTPAKSVYSGGRFDSVDGAYSYLYAGGEVQGAVVEVLLRDVPASSAPAGAALPDAKLANRVLSPIALRRPITLLALHGPGLLALGQDKWLTGCDAHEYPHTREWAYSMREWYPKARGFSWRSRLDDSQMSYVLFGDRVSADTLIKQDRGVALPTLRGKKILRPILQEYGFDLSI